MATANFRFHGELNDFLAPSKKQGVIVRYFQERASIKDMIEAIGIPHPEVNSIEVNGKAVDFTYIVTDGDRINVYPVTRVTEVTPIIRLQPLPLPDYRFVLDIHLGKLATSLRLLGFDTLYRNNYSDQELAQISADQARILLTRDRGLMMRSLVTYGYYVRETNPERQVVEVLRRYDLFKSATPFHRCLRCNGLLTPADKETLLDQLPVKTQLYVQEFNRCQVCGQIYWQGSHYKKMQQFVERVLNSPKGGKPTTFS